MASKYQKRHYEDVAHILKCHHWPVGGSEGAARDCWATICGDFASLFATDNLLFDRERFLKACGLETA